MRLLDLTHIPESTNNVASVITPSKKVIGEGSAAYTANLYDVHHEGMYGTYLDLPGHIEETHDGRTAASAAIESFYRMEAVAIHLDVANRSGAVTAEMLSRACPAPGNPQAVVINALGTRRFDEIEERCLFLTHDAVDWIIHTGCSLLVSDIYESQQLHGVFPRLFGAGISTVCHPVRLHEIDGSPCLLTIMFIPYPSVTQLPCRIVAELNEPRSD